MTNLHNNSKKPYRMWFRVKRQISQSQRFRSCHLNLVAPIGYLPSVCSIRISRPGRERLGRGETILFHTFIFLGPPKKRGHTKKKCRLAISHFVQHIIKSAKTRDRTDQWDKTMYNEKKSAQVGVIFCAIKMWVKRLNIYRLFLSNIIKKLVFLNH